MSMGWTEEDRTAVRTAIRAMIDGKRVQQATESTSEVGASTLQLQNATLGELRQLLREISAELDDAPGAFQMIGGR